MGIPTVAPSRFGPLARKALGKYRSKAEGDTPSKEPEVPKVPKAPKAEKPKEEPQTQAPFTEDTSPVPFVGEEPANSYPQAPAEPVEQLEQVSIDELPPPAPPEGEPPNGPEDPDLEVTLEEETPKPPPLQPIQISFYQSIKEHPNDDAPRLIYADWLEEEGNQPDLANAMRLDIYIANTRDKVFNDDIERNLRQAGAQLQTLEREHPEWFAPWGWGGSTVLDNFSRSARDSNGSAAVMNRGMLVVTSSALRFASLLQEYDPQQLLANVEYLRLRDSYGGREIRGLFQNATWLSYVTSLDLNHNSVWRMEDVCAEIGDNDGHGKNLQELYLVDAGIDNYSTRVLAASRHLENLRTLDLSDNEIGEGGIQALAEAPSNRFPNLQFLGLRGMGIPFSQRRALRRRYGNRVRMDDFE